MSNQIVISSGAKVRELNGVLTGTSGIVSALGINVPSGIPQLDGSGKILVSQLPNSVMEYKGTWNAATNTPTLVNGTGNAGDVYLCNVAGTVNFGAGPITFAIGDQVLYSGTTWERASGATGTVTSVAVTESGDALSITGSPITTSGTINIGFAGTSGQYVNGAGGLTTFPSLTGYVPYTGATQAVNLGAYDLTVNELTVGKGTSGLSNNTALGHQALFHITTGNYNTGVGHESLHNTSTGQYNTAIGQSSLFTNTTGSQNTALGLNALLYNTTGGSNVVVGLDGMQHNTTGSSNTALGYNAGSHITGGSTPNTTASNSIYIGRDSKAKVDGGANEIVIGYNAIGNGSNTATFGNTSTTANYFTGSINGGSFVKSGGTSSQFLKADGSVDSSTYLTTSAAASTYLPLTGGTLTGGLGGTSAAFSGTLGVTGNVSLLGNLGAKYGIIIEKGNTPATLSLNDVYISASSGTTNSLKIQNTNYLSTLNFAQSNQTFTFPEASGTLALTSDIPSLTGYVPTSRILTINGVSYNLTADASWTVTDSSKLPLSGGTLTGALSGTSATFSGQLTSSVGRINGRLFSTSDASFGDMLSTTGSIVMSFDSSGQQGYLISRNYSTSTDTPLNYGASKHIFNGGNVGIGTSSPVKPLEIYKAGSSTSQFRIGDSSTSKGYLGVFADSLYINAGGSYDGGWSTDGTNGIAGIVLETSNGGSAIAFGTANGNTSPSERMRITSGGSVLIGKIDATIDAGDGVRMDQDGGLYVGIVNGESSYYLRDITNAVYRFRVSGAGTIFATNTTISSISDERLKENIQDLDIGLDAIMALRPRKYDWKPKSGNSGKNIRGFIAQEVEAIFPDLIDESDIEGEINYKSLRQDFIPILVKAIQEQQAQIEELKALIAAK